MVEETSTTKRFAAGLQSPIAERPDQKLRPLCRFRAYLAPRLAPLHIEQLFIQL
ncbi:MAG: hypothetical protein AMXMBFR33_61440 [Candidatus Xenobia bacterium]